ncbi:hypothetical protein LZ31DRAFT_115072 [Colletotrichum somersetense]|nr:hypothetical protein LZ31DRAFT_115072 [Colletotrichum somersetense]
MGARVPFSTRKDGNNMLSSLTVENLRSGRPPSENRNSRLGLQFRAPGAVCGCTSGLGPGCGVEWPDQYIRAAFGDKDAATTTYFVGLLLSSSALFSLPLFLFWQNAPRLRAVIAADKMRASRKTKTGVIPKPQQRTFTQCALHINDQPRQHR